MTVRPMRSLLCGLAAVFFVWMAGGRAKCQDFSNRLMKLVVPYPAGGPMDFLGRAVAEYQTQELRQTVIVENKPGAQGSLGADAVAKAAPDGYTLLVAAGSTIVPNTLLYKKFDL
ncbi:Bug family tripartite tricarboxylate transporter substrate binding protein [Bradyrhizobium japonicum]|uniref:Bug family tripartite tricarboxylate transporter substrate binding protein n=1 Tax=Bradyrhizobium japonicum TaxID=375 RepID=UPI001BAD5F2F|nr:tripartite tricarboxylate transporter substrate-binding protein [Bradyrhizobium japonicum]MBR0911494.1 hypothetical protein [Bradyrhizobium japonicum]